MPLTPLLNVADVDGSAAFYARFGFEIIQRAGEDGTTIWVLLAAGPARLMLNRQDRIDAAERRARPPYGDVVLYIDVASAHEMHARLAAAGIEVGPVERQDYGLDEFRLRDPDGYELAIVSEASEAA